MTTDFYFSGGGSSGFYSIGGSGALDKDGEGSKGFHQGVVGGKSRDDQANGGFGRVWSGGRDGSGGEGYSGEGGGEGK